MQGRENYIYFKRRAFASIRHPFVRRSPINSTLNPVGMLRKQNHASRIEIKYSLRFYSTLSLSGSLLR